MQEAEQAVYEQAEEVARTQAGYLPQVTASTRAEYNSVLDRNVNVATVTASQLLYDFGRTGGAVDVAVAGREQREYELLAAVDRVVADTAAAYVEVQRNLRLRDIAADQVAGLEEIAGLVQERAERGAGGRSDLRQAHARVHAARITQSEIVAALDRAMRDLRQHVPVRSVDDLARELPDAVHGACVDPHLNTDDLPDVQAASAARAAAGASQRVARAERMPRVSLDYQVDRFFDSRIDDQTQSAVFLNVSLDLFRGGANRAQTRGASFAVERADATRRSTRMEAERALENAQTHAGELRSRQALFHERLDYLEESRQLQRTQYVSLGQRSLIDLLNVEQEFFQARFDAASTEFELHDLQIDCLKHGGRLRAVLDIDSPLATFTEDFRQ